jgi:hypothetical protein
VRRATLAAMSLLGVIVMAPTCAPEADVDGSGVVDLADLEIVQGCFGTSAPLPAGCVAADVNGDGRVDILDASIVASSLVEPTVPFVAGLTPAEAQQEFVARGLALGTTSEVPHLLTPPGFAIGQTPAGGSSLAAGSPVDVLVSAPAPAEATALPPIWQGTWEVTTTFTSRETGALFGVERAVVELCAGDPLGLAMVPSEALCTGSVDDTDLAFACEAQRSVASCTIDLTTHFEVHRTGPTLSGAGRYTFGGTGGCAGIVAPADENVQLAATRISTAVASCGGPLASVSQKLVRQPNLAGALAP